MILLGASTLIAYIPKQIFHLNILKPRHAILCGLVNSALQLSVGVSGATLDIFFLNRKLNRHQVVATKAITQAIGHLAKIYYFGFALSTVSDASISDIQPWLIVGILVMTLLGTRISKHFLNKMNDTQFHSWTRHIITIIGIIYVFKGVSLLQG